VDDDKTAIDPVPDTGSDRAPDRKRNHEGDPTGHPCIWKFGTNYLIDKSVDGKRYRFSSRKKTLEGAKGVLVNFEVAIEHGIHPRDFIAQRKAMTAHTNRTIERYLEELVNVRHISQEYARQIRGRLAPLTQRVRLRDVTPQDIEQILASKESSTTAYGSWKYLNIFFRWAVRRKLARSNPCAEVTPPKPVSESKDRRRAVPVGIIKKLRFENQPHYRYITIALWGTGLRYEELRRLELTNVNLDKMEIYVSSASKGKKGRHVPLPDAVVGEALLHVLAFKDSHRGLPGSHRMNIALERECRRKGVARMTVSALRHSYITDQLSRGVPPHVVQEIVGHESILTTLKYTHYYDTYKMPKSGLEENDL
jgi:integrase